MKRAAIFVVVVLCARVAHAGNCTFSSAPTTLDFGTYLPLTGGALQQLMTFTVDCVPPETVTVSFSTGQSPLFDPRTMKFAPYTLNYNIFRNAGRTEIWGDGSGSTFTQSKTMTVGDRTLTVNVYGQVPGSQNVGASSPAFYTDQITATIVWSGGSKSSTKTFQVQAKVDAECTVSTMPLAFGNYDPVAANATIDRPGTGVVNVLCTPGTSVNVFLDLGSNASGSTRRMLGPSGNLLNYEIYRDTNHTSIWGSTVPTSNSGAAASISTPINNGFTAFGLVTAGQDVLPGNYGDTVLVTVNY